MTVAFLLGSLLLCAWCAVGLVQTVLEAWPEVQAARQSRRIERSVRQAFGGDR